MTVGSCEEQFVAEYPPSGDQPAYELRFIERWTGPTNPARSEFEVMEEAIPPELGASGRTVP